MSASPFPTQPPPQRAVPTSAPDEFEVLPPEGAGGRRSVAPSDAMSRLIAYLMDNLIKVPGTKNMRVGANPFLDLIPGIGDAAATVIQAAVILEAQRRGVPKAVIARMGANVLVNGLMGMIPGVGEAFAFWFRPTTRNYNLLLRNAP